jgi:hypothetical protein
MIFFQSEKNKLRHGKVLKGSAEKCEKNYAQEKKRQSAIRLRKESKEPETGDRHRIVRGT